jgi:ABC-type sugar transport system ATPase subunit
VDQEGEDATEPAPLLEARGLVKRYGHVVALAGADFDLYPGEVLGVIGDNGAGKSTLIKCLSGATVPDEGEILLDGGPVQMRTPLEARAMGIETVYQTLAVSPSASTRRWRYRRRWTSRRTCSSGASRDRRGSWACCCAGSTSAGCATRRGAT